jgi:hypothetical protein
MVFGKPAKRGKPSLSESKKELSLTKAQQKFSAVRNLVYESLFLNQIGPVSSQISPGKVLRNKFPREEGARRRFSLRKFSKREKPSLVRRNIIENRGFSTKRSRPR